ncbi:hypothetical protein [Paenibacillus sp. MER 99-2]|uniref:hypothetical protein n=1 Tax=Paenibacillus sp. MER 99-2 TaxID=2939572 RepID=UPI0020413275|nr:hypothetical protein [Paenibacillus sp. MER 99-2]MCM3174464.1 hypothetical protein [Paenibacillus sp. MER 99-2]
MILVKHTGEGSTPVVTALIYNADPDQATTHDIWIDKQVPVSEDIPGMTAQLHIRLEDNALFYNYSKPMTWQDYIAELRKQQEVIKAAMDDLIMGGGL